MHFGSGAREPGGSGARLCHCHLSRCTSKAAEPKGRGTPCRRKDFPNISHTGRAAVVSRPSSLYLKIFSELSIELPSVPPQEKENMPLPGQGQRPRRKGRGGRQTAERN